MIDFNKYKENKEEKLNNESDEILDKLERIDADAIMRLLIGENIENKGNVDNTLLNEVDREKAWEGLEAGKRSIEFLKKHDPTWGKR